MGDEGVSSTEVTRAHWWVWYLLALALGIIALFGAALVQTSSVSNPTGSLFWNWETLYEILFGCGIGLLVVSFNEPIVRLVRRRQRVVQSVSARELNEITMRMVAKSRTRIAHLPGWNLLLTGPETYENVESVEQKLYNLLHAKAVQSAQKGKPRFMASYDFHATMDHTAQPDVGDRIEEAVNWSDSAQNPKTGFSFRVPENSSSDVGFRFLVADNDVLVWAKPVNNEYEVVLAEGHRKLADSVEQQFHWLRPDKLSITTNNAASRALSHHAGQQVCP